MAAGPAMPTNRLSMAFYTAPRAANMAMTRADLRETLLATDGWILACGHSWDIVAKHIGTGVYRVTLKEHKGSAP